MRFIVAFHIHVIYLPFCIICGIKVVIKLLPVRMLFLKRAAKIRKYIVYVYTQRII